MSSPNVNASPESVANQIDGIDGNGNELSFRKVAMFFDAHMFGLAFDYAFPEGPNESASMADHAASLAKLFTRTKKLSDGNDYTVWDAIMTVAKATVLANPHINDDEPLSVNYKKSS